MTTDRLTAAQLIRLLGLNPHPEGGHYRETFRDARCVDGRSVSTAIYFLLAAGEASTWHRLDATEVWHWYAGDALGVTTSDDAGATTTMRVGPDIAGGERPQLIVPAGTWQSARSLGAWSLVGCTVAPGFEFSGFEMAPPALAPRRAKPQNS
jgi:predicted cupin superfamily sugar epimerase